MAELDEFAAGLLADPTFLAGAAEGLSASNIDEDPVLSFFDRVRWVALQSLDKAAPVSNAPAVVILSDDPKTQARSLDAQAHRLVDIDKKNPDAWQGKLIFAASHGTAGWWIPLPNGSEDEALELLEAHGLGAVPVVIVYPANRSLSCFQSGGMSDDAPIRLDLPTGSRPVTIQDIFEVMEDIRRNSLLTPMIGPPKFWNDGAAYVPGDEAERQIQWITAAQLRSNFRPIVVDTEQVTPVGRIDIVMTDPNASGDVPRHPAIIELKALKSNTANANAIQESVNVKAVLKGLRQTKAYREVKGAHVAVLASFDMRKSKTDIMQSPLCVQARARYFTDERLEAYIFKVYGDPGDAQEDAAAA